MGILDWFINRPAQFDPDRSSEELIERAIDKAVQLTNPRIKLVRDYRQRLRPAVGVTIDYLRSAVQALPAPIDVASSRWSDTPSLRAFFAAHQDVARTVGRSSNLRTLFEKYPQLDQACFVLGMACEEQRVFGMALSGDVVQREVAQTVLVFSDHQARICGQDENEVRRLVGVQAFEYLVAEALAQAGEERSERRELEEARALLRARLRLLEQQGPGFGSILGAPAGASAERARLESELMENEQQLESCVPPEGVLEAEFELLNAVLAAPGDYLVFEARHTRLSTLNVVLEGNAEEAGLVVDYSLVRGSGMKQGRRAFVLGRFARADLNDTGLDFAQASRLL